MIQDVNLIPPGKQDYRRPHHYIRNKNEDESTIRAHEKHWSKGDLHAVPFVDVYIVTKMLK